MDACPPEQGRAMERDQKRAGLNRRWLDSKARTVTHAPFSKPPFFLVCSGQCFQLAAVEWELCGFLVNQANDHIAHLPWFEVTTDCLRPGASNRVLKVLLLLLLICFSIFIQSLPPLWDERSISEVIKSKPCSYPKFLR